MVLLGLMKYSPAARSVNLGDYIQSIATRQFLPRVDVLIDREQMSNYEGAPVKMIINGWFMTNPKNWPPKETIHPLITSFHINGRVEQDMLSEESVNYLRKHQPIGCRDLHTRDILQQKVIDSFFSGCMTLTLGRTYKRTFDDGKIYFVNVLDEFPPFLTMLKHPRTTFRRIRCGQFWDSFFKKKLMRKMFSPALLNKAIYLEQSIKPNGTEDFFALADDWLKKLLSAHLVVTSKIHTALPCLAMGVPVIFVNGGLYEPANIGRLSGLVELMNQIHIDRKHNITTSFNGKLPITPDIKIQNPDSYRKYATELIKQCQSFIDEK